MSYKIISLAASTLAMSLMTVLPPAVAQAQAPSTPPSTPAEAVLGGTANFTIAKIASGSSIFTTLATALDAADLTEVLNSTGPFTIFAPTDEAFAALPPAAIEALLLPENKESLVELLSYHVVPGALRTTDLESGDVVTVEGSTMAIDVADTVTVNSSQVVVADVIASNGIIHVIDRVIIPPSDLADAESPQ